MQRMLLQGVSLYLRNQPCRAPPALNALSIALPFFRVPTAGEQPAHHLSPYASEAGALPLRP